MQFNGSKILENARLHKIKNYTVIFDSKKWSCDCRAGKLGKHCKHIDQAKKLELFGEAKALLQFQFDNAIKEFQKQFPEVQEILFEDGEIKFII